MAYTPPPRRRRSVSEFARQGLLDRARGGRSLLATYLPSAVGDRTNFIAGVSPDPAAAEGAGSFLSSISAARSRPSSLPTPTSSAVTRTITPPPGLKPSDVFKQLQPSSPVGSAPVPREMFSQPVGGSGQFGPQAAQTQAVQGVQGSTNILQSATDLANAQAQRASGEEGPEGVLAPAQSFLGRMIGEKGSGKRSDIGRSMMSAGAAMMKGSPDGTFATIGQGLETGLGGYQALKEDRRIQEDRDVAKKRRQEIEAGIDASIGEVTDADGNITRRALTEEEADQVRARGGAEGVELARVLRQETTYRQAFDDFTVGMDERKKAMWAGLPDAEAFHKAMEWSEGDEARQGRKQLLMTSLGYTEEAAELASLDAASTQAAINRGRDIDIQTDGLGQFWIIENGQVLSGAHGSPRAVDPLAQATLDAQRESTLWDQSSERRQTVTDRFKVLRDEVDYLPTLVENVEAINDEDIEDYFGRFGGMKKFVDEIINPDAPKTWKIGNVDNMLTALGIQNLSAFKGAISEKELATAMQNAGSIAEVKGLLNAIMARSINNTVMKTTEHMEDARGLDTLLANTTAARTSLATGTGGRFWSDPTAFGFDMGSEGEIGPDGERTGATGIYGMQRQTDAAMQDWIDQAVGGGGGDVNLAPPGSGVGDDPVSLDWSSRAGGRNVAGRSPIM